MIIRHGEKPDDSGNPPGVDENGKVDPHSLTQRGWQRAHALKNAFFPPRAGLTRPIRVYAPGDSGGTGRRCRQTVGPLCDYMGVAMHLTYNEDDTKKLANQLSILGPGTPTLVCWEHSRIPDILSHLDGPVDPEITSWPGSRYDVLLACTADQKGWKLIQVPELLLPGDSASSL